MGLDLKKFRFVILPGRDPDPTYTHYYREAYKCWYSVWGDAYKELHVDKEVYADDFTRQTEICSIFYDQECVGMLFLTWADLSNPAMLKDSYFKIWTKQDISQLTKDGPAVLICSNTTISKDWRKDKCHISMKDLVFYLTCYQRFKSSAANAMTGVTRRARGVHELSYRYGAVPLRENVVHFDEEDRVDVVAFYKDTIKEGPFPDIISLGRRLWAERLEVNRVVNAMPTLRVLKAA